MTADDPRVDRCAELMEVEPDTLTVLSMVTWRAIIGRVLAAAEEAGFLTDGPSGSGRAT